MNPGTGLYKVVFLLHLSAVVIGFGSAFVWPALAGQARKLEAKEAYAVNHIAFKLGTMLSSIPIYTAIALGVVLVIVSGGVQNGGYSFSQQWITFAFLLSLFAVLVAEGLHRPNLTAIDKLQEKLAGGDFTPSGDGPPKEVKELEERGKRAGMYGGILHLFWLLLMIDMIWKPGALS